ncbi:flagella synthesis protein FlgN [Oceanicoccus sp. KOV_DT_Chl]|uniref:flagella synthesis protein FlgN n=1 Tax=Oceanicoccus sp. KOV_DT_Chl TaxID=1904639 RepID=UPI000C7E61DD|nr:flagellar protein FlgN [Oceanicoccus sp. KOV_DT_Chl]
MAPYQALWSELEDTFKLDLPTTTQLLEVLQQERASLEQRDYDLFQKLIGQKQQLLKQLESHSQTRQKLLLEAGFIDESSTLDAAEEHAPLVAKAWRKLGEQWSQCQELNEVNERIAKRTRLVVGQILDLLRGNTHQPKLYTNKGMPKTAALAAVSPAPESPRQLINRYWHKPMSVLCVNTSFLDHLNPL